MNSIQKLLLVAVIGTNCVYAYDMDIILEFKAAYFQPQHHLFKKIYGGSALFGPELTVKIIKDLYAFASVDYLTKSGHSLGLCSPTHVNLVPIGIGLKYMPCFREYLMPYLGLGFLPTHVHTKDCSPYVIPNHNKWGLGGTAKAGIYFTAPYNFVFDLFFNYNFVKATFDCCNNTTDCCDNTIGYVQQHSANVSGFAVGAGLGYRFH